MLPYTYRRQREKIPEPDVADGLAGRFDLLSFDDYPHSSASDPLKNHCGVILLKLHCNLYCFSRQSATAAENPWPTFRPCTVSHVDQPRFQLWLRIEKCGQIC